MTVYEKERYLCVYALTVDYGIVNCYFSSLFLFSGLFNYVSFVICLENTRKNILNVIFVCSGMKVVCTQVK